MGYRGDYSFEVFNDDYQQMPLPMVAERARRSADWLGEEVLRRAVPLPGRLRLRRAPGAYWRAASREARACRTILILNGPNLNLLGTREPAVYGRTTLDDVRALCEATGQRLGLAVDFRQSNHEGVLIDWIHEAGVAHRAGTLLGVVFNAGAYTHTSVALHDAVKGAGVPMIEVHISNVHAREPFRHHSYLSPAAAGIVVGFGIEGYALAMDGLSRRARRADVRGHCHRGRWGRRRVSGSLPQSLLIGLSIAAPVGPIGLLVIQRTLQRGSCGRAGHRPGRCGGRCAIRCRRRLRRDLGHRRTERRARTAGAWRWCLPAVAGLAYLARAARRAWWRAPAGREAAAVLRRHLRADAVEPGDDLLLHRRVRHARCAHGGELAVDDDRRRAGRLGAVVAAAQRRWSARLRSRFDARCAGWVNRASALLLAGFALWQWGRCAT